MILFASFPHFHENIVIGPAFKLVVDFVVAFETFGIADTHVGTIVGDQPAFTKIPVLRGNRGTYLGKRGQLLGEMYQAMTLVCGDAGIVRDNANIGVTVGDRQLRVTASCDRWS